MSGSGDDRDDLDEVTLWAGRLRAWPALPVGDPEGDETVRSSRRSTSAGDPIRGVHAGGDETVRSSPRSTSAGDPIRGGDAEGDETVQSSRIEASGGDAASVPDARPDRTVRSPRSESDGADEERGSRLESAALPDDDTAPRRAGRAHAVERGGDDTVGGISAANVGGVTAADADVDVDVDATAAAVDTASADDTTASRRRQRAASDPVVEATVPGFRRDAHAPTALHRETYAPRRDAPVRVARRSAATGPSARDAAVVRPRRSRGGASLLVLSAAIVAVVALAAVGVLLLLG